MEGMHYLQNRHAYSAGTHPIVYMGVQPQAWHSIIYTSPPFSYTIFSTINVLKSTKYTLYVFSCVKNPILIAITYQR